MGFEHPGVGETLDFFQTA